MPTVAPARDSRNRPLPAGIAEAEQLAPEPIAPKKKGRYGAQNLVVLALQVAGWAALLFVVERAPVPLKIVGVLVFCALMQGVFSMMHEFFHDNAHPDRRVSYAIGFVGSLLFGTSATLHRVNHWGHHVRNRTPAEQGEFIHDDESAPKKVFVYYFAVLFGLWLSGLIFPFVAIFIPHRLVRHLAKTKRFNTYAAAFEQFKPRDWTRMRVEALTLGAFWTAIILWGPWSAATLVACYASFAFTWSSLQWVYHLRTPLHVIEGAYNLRLPLPLRWLFLNFNMNLTHHRRPYLPWQELHAASDPRETQPMWYRWLLMFGPPVRFPADPSRLAHLEKRYF